MISKSVFRLHVINVFMSIGAFFWGYHIGILASVLVNPDFKRTMGYPTAAQTGFIASIYYIGLGTGFVFISPLTHGRLGRRYAAMLGAVIVAVATAFESGAAGPGAYALMLLGRIISGVGVSLVSTSVVLYQSEIAPASQRGKFVVLHAISTIMGQSTAYWAGYAATFWNTPIYGGFAAWRRLLAIDFIPICVYVVGLPFLPESPRWLVEKNYHDRALASLRCVREGSFTNEEIELELSGIRNDVEECKSLRPSWLTLFRDPNLFGRLWRAFLLQFMAIMCGTLGMHYYKPILLRNLGLSRQTALMVGAIESTSRLLILIVETFLIDRLGRRAMVMIGVPTMAFSLGINGILGQIYPGATNRTSDIICIVFIFIYAFGYSCGLGAIVWIYASEIFPTPFRARGLSFAAAGSCLASIITTLLWPVGVEALGSGIYFFFMGTTLACIPIILIFYPETKGLALEDMDTLFKTKPRRVETPDEHDA